MSPLAPSEARWYYARNNKKVGPLTWEQLRHLATTGLLTPADMLLRDGETEWQPANNLPDLFRPRTISETKKSADNRVLTAQPAATRVTGRPPGAAAKLVEQEGASAFPQVPGYEVLGELGRGGMGVVYKARQAKLNRLVALKMILASGEASEAQLTRFDLEARSLARLKHPNIVQLYEVGEYQGQPFFSLELVEGGSLARRLDGKTLPAEQAAQLVETLARAMYAAHRHGIIHRDLKPANVLVAADGQLKVTDFGLAKDLRDVSGPTATGAVMGTPAYMAPEQAAGQTDQFGPHTDVYALGAILYEALCGSPPFSGPPQFVLYNVLEREPASPRQANRRIPVDLETICLKCLEKDPRQRYRSAAELAEELRCYRKGEPIQALPPRMGGRLLKWARRRPALAAVYALLLLVLALGSLGFGALSLWQKAEAARVAAESEREEAVEARAQLATEKQRTEAALQREEHARTVADQEKQKAINASQAAELARQKAELARQKAEGARAQLDTEKQRTDAALQREQQALQRLAQVSYVHRVELAHRDWQVGEVSRADQMLEDCPRNLRGWEWFYVKRLCQKLCLKGHTGEVTSVAFSPDGKRIVSGGGEWGKPGEVQVWDAHTGKLERTLQGHTSYVQSVAFSPDGKRIASGSVDRTVKVWDAHSGQEPLTLKRHTSAVWSVAFSPDGKRIASGSHDQSVQVWDAQMGEWQLTLKGHAGVVAGVAFSPDGKRIASGSYDRTVKLWDAQTGQALTLRGHTRGVTSVAFSADGKRIAAGSYDRMVTVWDAHSEQVVFLKGHTSSVRSVAISADGKRLATGSADNEVNVWDAQTGKVIHTLKGHSDSVNSVAFSADGKHIASGSQDQTVKVWDAQTWKEALTLKGHTSPVMSVAFSADGKRIAAGSELGTVLLWDAQVAKELLTLKRHTGAVMCVAFSPDGRRIATGSQDQTVKVWDVDTDWELFTLKGHSDVVYSVAFSPDGKRIASGSLDQTVKVWDAQTGQEALTLKGHRGPVLSVVFSPDGKRIVSGSWGARDVRDDKTDRTGEVRVWDATPLP
jgi:eukaryotic-like serine/threonine-protein kinase